MRPNEPLVLAPSFIRISHHRKVERPPYIFGFWPTLWDFQRIKVGAPKLESLNFSCEYTSWCLQCFFRRFAAKFSRKRCVLNGFYKKSAPQARKNRFAWDPTSSLQIHQNPGSCGLEPIGHQPTVVHSRLLSHKNSSKSKKYLHNPF